MSEPTKEIPIKEIQKQIHNYYRKENALSKLSFTVISASILLIDWYVFWHFLATTTTPAKTWVFNVMIPLALIAWAYCKTIKRAGGKH